MKSKFLHSTVYIKKNRQSSVLISTWTLIQMVEPEVDFFNTSRQNECSNREHMHLDEL